MHRIPDLGRTYKISPTTIDIYLYENWLSEVVAHPSSSSQLVLFKIRNPFALSRMLTVLLLRGG